MSLKLKTSDGEICFVDKDAIKVSTVLNGFDTSTDDEEPIQIENVSTEILRKVVSWAEHHKDEPIQTEEDTNENARSCDISDPWNLEFLEVEQGTLFDLILAANYLDIKGLLDLTCKKVASLIKGRSSEEIRKTFKIKNDFTPEEEEQVRKENEWCEL